MVGNLGSQDHPSSFPESRLRNWKLTLEYDGSDFSGWQIQPGQSTVQGVVTDAIERLTGLRRPLLGAGRTDAGVHAEGQVASVSLDSTLEGEELRCGINALTPDSVSVVSVQSESPGFDACRWARGKIYRYDLRSDPSPPALDRDRCHWVRGKLDRSAMRQAGRWLLGRHDFRAFQSAHSPRVSTERTVFLFDLEEAGNRCSIRVGADGFLYRMVRAIVGTLLEVGRGKRVAGEMVSIVESRDRRRAGPTAPASGLFLERVLY